MTRPAGRVAPASAEPAAEPQERWRLSGPGLVGLLGAGWVDGVGPLYEKLAIALQGAIEDGRLPTGGFLPAERQLAEALFVSRGTVVAAYAALRDRGLVASRRGSGTRVSGRPAGTFSDEETLAALARDPYLTGLIDERRAPIDLTVPAPRAALEHLAASGQLASLGVDLLKDATPLGYQPRGLVSLRRALARRLTAVGVPTGEDEVLVTNGGQQALSLLLELFVRPNDEVVVENPSHRGLIDALLHRRAHVLPVALDDPHLPRRLDRLLAERQPRLVLLTPTCHNPSGHVLDDDVRRELARVVVRHGIPLVEDVVLADLALDEPPPPIAARVPADAPVIVVGSLSKVLWGGLRVGWLRAPSPLVSRVARLKAVADMGTSAVSQTIGLQLLAQLETSILRIQREEVRLALATAEECLRVHLPDWRWRTPGGGRSLWARLPCGDATHFAQHALLHGVAITSGATLCFDGSGDRHVRLPFVQPPELLAEGCRRLGDAWNAYAQSVA
ncbi:MAG: PLP-dependent aminotransferase family protein [Thermoleophilia bacterium]